MNHEFTDIMVRLKGLNIKAINTYWQWVKVGITNGKTGTTRTRETGLKPDTGYERTDPNSVGVWETMTSNCILNDVVRIIILF